MNRQPIRWTRRAENIGMTVFMTVSIVICWAALWLLSNR